MIKQLESLNEVRNPYGDGKSGSKLPPVEAMKIAREKGKLAMPYARSKDYRDKFSVSERRACRGVDFSRCSIRYQRRIRNDEQVIRKRLHELARQRPRFGYRQMTRLLRLEGFRVSFKRVHRIWRAEGLKVRRKPKKKRAKGSSANSCSRLRAERPNHIWSWDFIFGTPRKSIMRLRRWIPRLRSGT